MFGGLGNLGAILGFATNIESRIKNLKGKLEAADVSSVAERRDEHTEPKIVEINANGLGGNIRVSISPSLLSAECKVELESMLRQAMEEAVRKAGEVVLKDVQEFAQESGLPGMDKMLAGFKK